MSCLRGAVRAVTTVAAKQVRVQYSRGCGVRCSNPSGRCCPPPAFSGSPATPPAVMKALNHSIQVASPHPPANPNVAHEVPRTSPSAPVCRFSLSIATPAQRERPSPRQTSALPRAQPRVIADRTEIPALLAAAARIPAPHPPSIPSSRLIRFPDDPDSRPLSTRTPRSHLSPLRPSPSLVISPFGAEVARSDAPRTPTPRPAPCAHRGPIGPKQPPGADVAGRQRGQRRTAATGWDLGGGGGIPLGDSPLGVTQSPALRRTHRPRVPDAVPDARAIGLPSSASKAAVSTSSPQRKVPQPNAKLGRP